MNTRCTLCNMCDPMPLITECVMCQEEQLLEERRIDEMIENEHQYQEMFGDEPTTQEEEKKEKKECNDVTVIGFSPRTTQKQTASWDGPRPRDLSRWEKTCGSSRIKKRKAKKVNRGTTEYADRVKIARVYSDFKHMLLYGSSQP